MTIALIRRRRGSTLSNALRIGADESEWEDLQAAIAHIKRSHLPVDAHSAGRIAQLLVDQGYSGEMTKNTRTTKEWQLHRAPKHRAETSARTGTE